jgi:hypothetical protein
MNSPTPFPFSPLFKLSAVLFAAAVAFGSTDASSARSFLNLAGFIILFALLDAGQAAGAGAGREACVTNTDIGEFVRRLFGPAVGPFYVLLAAVTFSVVMARPVGGPEVVSAPHSPWMCGSSKSGGCGSGGSAGCGSGGCGAASGGSCGCSSGKASGSTSGTRTAQTPAPAGSRPVQNVPRPRSVVPPGATLPGIGAAGKPLPPAIIPPSANGSATPWAGLPVTPGSAIGPLKPATAPAPSVTVPSDAPTGGTFPPAAANENTQTPSPPPPLPTPGKSVSPR